jgi:hypothetical protein
VKSALPRVVRVLVAQLWLVAAGFVVPASVQAGPFTSENRDVLQPNTGPWDLAGVTLGGTTFRNLGLQGMGRIAASAKDPATGESLGSISDMQVGNFANNANGTWSGTFYFLPDRGFNSGATFSNYAARINAVDFTFTPYTASLPTNLQNQIAMVFTGSTRFTYDHDNNSATAAIFTTGLLPQQPRGASLFGTTVPVVAGNTTQSDGTFVNRLALDAEGLILDPRAGKQGSGWVGDEYGAYVYHFNSAKQIDGVLKIPTALVPHAPAGAINFQLDTPALVNGRRVNQGMEGIALSPDGTKLFALLQSATIQDSGAGNQGRANAVRLLVYDVSASNAPDQPSAQYVIQLPRIDDNGGTPAVNRAGAQSSIIALNDHQLLILSRDGNGRGATGSPVFKSILLADISGATNINGLFDAEGNAVAPGGVLNASVKPITWIEALNMLGRLDLSITELEQFGLNLATAPGDINSLAEKWEALALVSAMDPLAPSDYFLFIGNDNDFLTQSGKLLDANGGLQDYNAGLENDTMVLAFRVQVVPEPGSLGLVAIGIVALALRRRARATICRDSSDDVRRE